jgi:hypothetical protein
VGNENITTRNFAAVTMMNASYVRYKMVIKDADMTWPVEDRGNSTKIIRCYEVAKDADIAASNLKISD